MPVRVMGKYDYIAHIQLEKGGILELEGVREDYNKKLVYSHLLQLATTHGGWLLSQHINEVEEDDDLPFVPDVAPHYIGVENPIPRVEVQEEPVPSLFEDRELFGIYYGEYKGAILCTYKETGT
jgi:hypothetical protein